VSLNLSQPLASIVWRNRL